jgi:anti-anti-sigma regulatory factor
MDTAIEVLESGNNRTVRLPDYCDISTVADLKQVFVDLIKQKPAKITLDSSAVEMIDTAVLQLITAFRKSARDTDIEINFENISDAFSQATTGLGLDREFGLVA